MSNIYSAISILLFFIMVLFSNGLIVAQDQNTINVKPQEKGAFNLPPYYLTLPIFDTIRPALSACGKGLQYYDCILLKHQDKRYSSKYKREEKSIMTKAAFTELELEILKQNMLFIDEQYQIQMKELIRKEKMDFNLGEAIKGFYMKPVF